jgi:anti-anti-sigma factor
MHPTASFERRSGRIFVIGELDLASSTQLDAVVAALDGETAVLDLRDLEFIDSSGIHALVRARLSRPDLQIVAVPDAVRRVLDLAGRTEYLLGSHQIEG